MKKFSIISLGCAKNLVDSEYICEKFINAGYEMQADQETADVVVVNTCAFLTSAVEESVKTLLELMGKGKKVVCTGCLVSRYKDKLLKKLPDINLFVGLGNYDALLDALNGKERYIEPSFGHVISRSFISTGASAYLKVCEGCSNHCNYCLIPSLRGELVSKPLNEVEREMISLAASGAKEIILVGQDLGSYGKDFGMKKGLVKLLEKITKIEGPEWIRIMYVHPASITDELIDVMKDNPKICTYIDLPIQHISDKVLKAMGRRGGRAAIEKAVERIVGAEISIRSTVMVGHPGEEKSDFNELENFISKGYFDHLGVFDFSPEQGTKSYKLKPRIPKKIKTGRKERIMAIQQEISRNKLKRLVGKRMKVLLEGYHGETDLLLRGRAVFQSPDVDGIVIINEGNAPFGSFCDVEITDSMEYDLVGRIV